MKRAVVILIVGIALGLAGFCTLYFGKTASHFKKVHGETPELAWLKVEFNLSDAEFKRIADLHKAYLPDCAQMCRRIAAKNEEMRVLLRQTNSPVAAVEGKLSEAAELRLECQKRMFRHFVEVSQAMPPAQGKRYLAWVQERTLLDGGMMADTHHGHE